MQGHEILVIAYPVKVHHAVIDGLFEVIQRSRRLAHRRVIAGNVVQQHGIVWFNGQCALQPAFRTLVVAEHY